MKKYSLKHARNYYFRKSVFERISIWFEKQILSLKDQYRFFKLDKTYIGEAIKELVYLLILCFIINKIGCLLLDNENFRNISIINLIINNVEFIIESYNQYLIACLGVAGFLAGLFLSNLSGIITSRYSNIVSKVSLNVLNEYLNKKYLKSIINYLCLVVVQLALWFFNASINPLLSLVTVFFTIKIIIIYFDLSRRVFMFSNINALTVALCREIDIIFHHLKAAVNFNKSDSIFHYYNKQLLENIDILGELQKQLIKEQKSDCLCDFTIYIMGICISYSKFKNTIQRKSCWFPIEYVANNWFEADYSEINIRTRTGTFISNKQEKDLYFLENRVKTIFSDSVKFLIKDNDIKGLYKIIKEYSSIIYNILLNCGDFEYWNNFNDCLEELILRSDISEDEDYEALIKVLGCNKVNFILASEKYISDTYNNFFVSGFKTSAIIKKNNHYLLTTREIIEIVDQLRYEKNIEKKLITPNEYVCECFIVYFIKNINIILKMLYNNYDRICMQAMLLGDKSNKISACLLYSKILEFENEAKNAIMSLQNIYDILIKNNNNFKFDNFEGNELIKKMDITHYVNLMNYAKVFINMDNYDYKKVKIDFCGALFYAYSEAIFDTVLNNDYNNFALLYDIFVSLCFKAEDFIYGNLDKNYNPNYLISKYKIPMIMYMDLNGYIIYHSHLICDNRWQKKVERSFNNIINTNNSYDILKRLAAIASFDFGTFDMNDMKLNFRQRYSNHLTINNLVKTKFSSKSLFARKIVDSDDIIISEFTSIDFQDYVDFHYKFYEIFILIYVNPKLKSYDQYHAAFRMEQRGDSNE